ncbi:MAG: hypothetical protein K2I64_03100 [Muribaculaceae bacterium]|nr:hypothetical protein [Muribaculaceae bacterium]
MRNSYNRRPEEGRPERAATGTGHISLRSMYRGYCKSALSSERHMATERYQ